jgi:glycosyltransferase involved in cell wall biosynthesis
MRKCTAGREAPPPVVSEVAALVNVLYVYPGDWPRNATRPAKQTRSLAEAGHRVHLLSGNPRGEPQIATEDWLTVERIPSFGSPRLHRLLGFPVFVNPVWLWAIIRAARLCDAECIIVRDLPLAAAALAVGTLLGIPVHFEMADVYPVGMRSEPVDRPGLATRITRSITRNPTVWEMMERLVIRRVATVFVVSDESRDRCLGLGVPPERVVIVGNTPENLAALQRDYPIPADIADWAGRPMMLFVGNLLPSRGLPAAIEAIAIVAHDIPEVAFVIVGDGPEKAELQTEVEKRGLHQHVRLLGWKPHAEHAPYYARSTIGVLPFVATKHICITLANKLFDYMGAGLPVLASDVPPMRRVLLETGAGLLAPPSDVTALAQGILRLIGDPELRRRLGEAGRRAAETTYAWAEDRRRFLDAVERPLQRS